MRGETQRVAERVRELLDNAHQATLPADEPLSGWAEAFDEVGPQPGSVHDTVEIAGGAAGSGRGHTPGWRDRLAARVPLRLDPGHRAAVGIGVAVLVVAVVTGAWLWLSGPRTADVAAAPTPIAGASTPVGSGHPSAAPTPTPSASGTAAPSAADVVVDVAGKVARPGVYHLPGDARVADAVAAAGGAKPGVDLTPVNLAARLTDGQQIVVGSALPKPGAGATSVGPSTGANAGGSAGASALVDLNTATLEQLETLPGIGPALGQRILDYRAAQGSFTGVDQLNDVSGIGDVKFAALKSLVTV